MAERKIILTGKDARSALLKGVNALAEVVGITMGPMGQNVVITKNWFTPHVTKDGVTVAKEVILMNQVENAGAQIVKQAAQAAADNAGDGTTTATVLCASICNLVDAQLNAGCTDIREIKNGILQAQYDLTEVLKEKARPCGTQEEILAVATISANGDSYIAGLLSDAFKAVGKDGLVYATESGHHETKVTVSEGFSIDRGYYNPIFITNRERASAEYKDPLVLLTDRDIDHLSEILPVLEYAANEKRPLVVIAKEFSAEAVSTVALNMSRGLLKALLIKAPGFGDRQYDLLQDISLFTGATVVGDRSGVELAKVSPDILGTVKIIRSTKDKTSFIGTSTSAQDIAAYATAIRVRAEQETDLYEKEKLEQRLATVAGSVAVVSVGGRTEVEIKELKDRVDDAIHAVRAAIDSGYLPGGGTAIHRAAFSLYPAEITGESYTSNDGFKIGYDALLNACAAPLRCICTNAGVNANDVLALIKADVIDIAGQDPARYWYGYNAANKQFEDLGVAGVIDPLKVTLCALDAAVSAGLAVLSTGAVIIEDTAAIPLQTNMGMPAFPGMKY